ncbi:hypothetical protein BaRGS_00021263 [Batillaria attramentaria]|uniref:Uncharacterized protein n=1 Tax=Batillaria attramentaria TaxID=370345 RepID=A0ABD0KKD2_9CAEN
MAVSGSRSTPLSYNHSTQQGAPHTAPLAAFDVDNDRHKGTPKRLMILKAINPMYSDLSTINFPSVRPPIATPVPCTFRDTNITGGLGILSQSFYQIILLAVKVSVGRAGEILCVQRAFDSRVALMIGKTSELRAEFDHNCSIASKII